MAGREDHLDAAAAQVEHLAVLQIVDFPLVVRHELRHVHRVGGVDPDLREVVDGAAGVVRMHMRGNQGDGLLRDARDDLVQVVDLGAGVQENRLFLPFDDIDGLVGHQVAVAFPGVGVDLPDDHVRALIDDGLGIAHPRHALGRALPADRILESRSLEHFLRTDIGGESQRGGTEAEPLEGVAS